QVPAAHEALLLGLRQTQKHFRSRPHALQVELALVDIRRGGTALDQTINRFPGRARGVFKRERDVPFKLDVLTQEAQIGYALRNHGWPVATLAAQPDVGDVGHVAGNADRRAYDLFRFRLPFLQTDMLQQFPQYLLACALIHGLWIEVAFLLRKEPIAPPDKCTWRLAEDFRLLEDRQRDHPVRIFQSQEPAASRVAVGQIGDLIEELRAGRGHGERYPARIGDPVVTKECIRISEALVLPRQRLPQGPRPP